MSTTKELVIEEKKEMGSKLINPDDPSSYGCQILLEKTTLEKTKDKSFPNDARIITYIVDGNTFIDLTRANKMVDLFDFYYDKYGPGSVQRIEFGYGTVSPKLWGYKAPEGKKKR